MNRSYQFGPFRLDQRSGSVWQGSEEIHLTAKAFSTLLLLVENAGSLVTKETLLERVWPEGFIEPANVTQTVYMLRKALAGPGNGRAYIDTIAGRGYRFVAPVAVSDPDSAVPASSIAAGQLRRPRAVAWPFATLAIAVAALTLHSSAPPSVQRAAVSPEAQRDYILGRHYWSERTSESLRRGLHYFQAALRVAPSYALASSGIADSYSAMGYYAGGDKQRLRYYSLSEDAARRAIALDPASAEAHASLAFVVELYGKRRFAEATREFEESIALNPDYATAREWYSWFLYGQNHPDEALAQMDKARDLDPLSPIINYALGYQLFYQRRFKESSAQWHQAIAIAPFADTSYYGAGLADEQTGQLELAERELRRAYALSPRDPDVMGALAHVFATRRQLQDAQRLVKRIAGITPMPAYSMAVVSAGLGRQDAALKWLRVAKAEHDPSLQSFDMDPRFDRLRQQYRKVTAFHWT